MLVAAIIGSFLRTLTAGAVVLAVLLAALIALSLAPVEASTERCDGRLVTRSVTLASEFVTKWDDAGEVPLGISESEATSQVQRVLDRRSGLFHGVMVCFDAEAGATARADVDVSWLGRTFPSLHVELRGAADLSGPVPRVELSEVRLGRVPVGLARRLALPAIERTINEQIADAPSPGDLAIAFEDGAAVVTRR